MDELKKVLASVPGVGVLLVAVVVTVSSLGLTPVEKGQSKKKADDTPVPARDSESKSSLTKEDTASRISPLLEYLRYREYCVVDPFDCFKSKSDRITDVLIQTIYDPIETHMGYLFDHSIEATTRAMIAADYCYEDHWFPWELNAKQKSTARLYRENPGLLVFRKNHAPDDRLFVLLVGENPMNGVHPRAMELAFKICDDLSCENAKRIKLVGPCMSGTMPSILRGISERKKRTTGLKNRGPVQVISGAATGIKSFGDYRRSDVKTLFNLSNDDVRIHTTQQPNITMTERTLRFLENPKCDLTNGEYPPDRKVAFLVELNSAFGAGFQQSWKKGIEENDPIWRPWLFRFPMHISRLTGIQTQERREREEKLGLAPLSFGGLAKINESRAGQDVIPPADEMRTALINQRALEDIWASIRRVNVRYVGIVATDVRDKIFLVEQLRANCSSVQPFITGADLHLVHPSYLHALRGVIVVSTYPLNPAFHQWTKRDEKDRTRTVFPGGYAEGIHNAILASLAEDSEMGTEKRKKLQGAMTDYAAPFTEPNRTTAEPPIVLTVIGETGRMVPLAIGKGHVASSLAGSNWNENGLVYQRDHTENGTPHYSFPQMGPLRAPIIVLVIAAGFLAWRIYPRFVDNEPSQIRPLLLRVAIGCGALYAVLPVALFLANGSILKPLTDSRLHELDEGLCLAAILAGHIAFAVSAWRTYEFSRTLNRTSKGSNAALAASATALIGTFAVFWAWTLRGTGTATEALFFLDRFGGINSGYSILWPMTILAGGVVAWAALGWRLIERNVAFAVPNPLAETMGVSNVPGWEAPPWTLRSRKHVWFVAGGLAVLIFTIVPRAFRTYEGASFDWFVVTGFGAGLTLTAVSAIRLIDYATGLKEFLRRLSLVPLLPAFRRLPDFVAGVAFRTLIMGKRRNKSLYYLHVMAREIVTLASRERAPTKFQCLNDLPYDEGDLTGPAVGPYVAAATTMARNLTADWNERSLHDHSVPESKPDAKPGGDDPAKGRPSKVDRAAETEKELVAKSEEFIALATVLSLAAPFDRFRHWAMMLATTTLAVMFAATNYAFQPEQTIMTCVIAMSGVSAVLIVWAVIQVIQGDVVRSLNRSTFLSPTILMPLLPTAVPIVVLTFAQLTGRLRGVFEPVLAVLR